jgi:CDP-diacylglycerol---glycerol-3-phosphate 3-phosphatidyltransferase
MSPAPVRWTSPANLFTFLRVALVPVVLWLLLVATPAARWGAFVVFVVAALTDTLDGTIARRSGGVNPFGELADPLADKLLVGGVLVSLALVGDVAWWVVVVIVAREVAVTALRARLVRRRGHVMAASVWGKVKTVVQLVAVGLVLLPVADALLARRALEVAAVLTVWSGIDYGLRAARLGPSDSPERAEVGS